MTQSTQETFEEHDEIIHQNILPRLRAVEEGQKELKVEMAHIARGQTQLENTIMKDGQHTRETVNKLIDHITETRTKELDTKAKIIVGVTSAIFGGGTVAAIFALFI